MTANAPQPRVPGVLFVCVRNGGKSQMAAALMRHRAGDAVEVHSAGTDPGPTINALSAEAVAELGADMSGKVPRAIDPDLLRRVDRVVVLGADAARDLVARGDVGVSDDDTARTVITWITDEPSGRGIDGLERMRLIRDDIDRRVHDLLAEFTAERADPSPR
ncbi:low molecular weight phosphatase family protein [Dietzia aurantiaca]|uniref:arsenate-mycothiol transferase ArsC n=1 Tax=Dietzia aurantiaca TaxID=983873 RepID=UPI001E51A1F4|nr:low molecular weight phosphatase family protein [Dietzia aurantiaca]MCD2262706.1 low molecular weight phosphatase family protein [Dietzia aurantiaca]